MATTGAYNDLTGKPTLGTAAAKDSTNAVTASSTALVESGAVKDAIDNAIEAIDLSGYVEKSQTAGLLKNDGTVDTTQYLSQHQDISGKADKVSGGTTGDFASLDANGNLADSGHKHSDYLTQHQDITGKADKVSSATSGHFAGLDGNGNLTDSGIDSAIVPSTASSSNKLATMADVSGGGSGLGTRVSATVDDDTVSFTDASIPSGVIDGPYVADLLMNIDDVTISGTTVTYTFTDDTADGKTAYIWVRDLS